VGEDEWEKGWLDKWTDIDRDEEMDGWMDNVFLPKGYFNSSHALATIKI